jgi:hypothetical protein
MSKDLKRLAETLRRAHDDLDAIKPELWRLYRSMLLAKASPPPAPSIIGRFMAILGLAEAKPGAMDPESLKRLLETLSITPEKHGQYLSAVARVAKLIEQAPQSHEFYKAEADKAEAEMKLLQEERVRFYHEKILPAERAYQDRLDDMLRAMDRRRDAEDLRIEHPELFAGEDPGPGS